MDAARKRECPRCQDIKLMRHRFNPKSAVEVDQCPNCGGYWLDHGELAKIREERGLAARAEAADPTATSPDLIRYLYKVRTAQRNEGR